MRNNVFKGKYYCFSKLFIVICFLTVINISGCDSLKTNSFIGTWKAIRSQSAIEQYLVIKDDGLIEIVSISKDGISVAAGKWTKSMKKPTLTITMDSKDRNCDFRRNYDTLLLKYWGATEATSYASLGSELLVKRRNDYERSLSAVKEAVAENRLPLFNPTEYAVSWNQGPIVNYSINSLLRQFTEEIGRRFDNLKNQIPAYDKFLKYRENLNKYDSVVINWEKGFFAFLDSNASNISYRIVDDNNFDKYYKRQLVGYSLDESKAIDNMFSEEDKRAYSAQVSKAVIRGYNADGRSLAVESDWSKRPLAIANIDPSVARELFKLDSASMVVIEQNARPCLLYRRQHSCRWDGGYGYPDTDDWAIRATLFIYKKQVDAFGLHAADGGKRQDLIYPTNYRAGSKWSDYIEYIYFTNDKKETLFFQ